MKIPSLETPRLEMVAPSLEAFIAYLDFYTDEAASDSYGGPLSREQTWARLKGDLGAWYLLGFGVWVLREKSTSNSIGTCGFWKGKDWPTELTWWLLPAARGKGLAEEASRAAIDHAYRQWRWDAVETYMNDDNVAARNLVLKLGGVVQCRRSFPDGLERDVYRLPGVV